MTVEVLSIGDELLIGQVVNTNASWLGDQLARLGATVRHIVTLGDSEDDIQAAVRLAASRADLVIVTGGLGPTHDDKTKEAVAALYGATIEFRQDLYDDLEARFRRVGKQMSLSNRSQAEVPAGFEVLPNRWGSAPGLYYEAGEADIAILPGVPREMKGLFDAFLAPRIEGRTDTRVLRQKTLLTTGIAESRLHDMIGDIAPWEQEGASLAFLPNLHGVRLRLSATGGSADEAAALLARFEARVRPVAGPYLYGEGSETLEGAVGGLLSERGLWVATAESCTSGLVASRLTDVPGASAWVRGGVVAYDNAVKMASLGVAAETINSHGAVSREVVSAMAEGVRERLGADVGVATSGIMGPGGGSADKPVGTLWLAVATSERTVPLKVMLRHDRGGNKAQAATAALNLLRRVLLG